jgi:inorganic phosphate transporter, PiT family
MSELPLILILTLFLSLLFAFNNGERDSGNAIATLISERITTPRVAVILCAVMNLLGALLGTGVALTVAHGLTQMGPITSCRILALSALVGAMVWNGITRFLGLPSSSFHSLIGGLCGAAVACGGWDALNYANIFWKVLLPLVFSPLGGFFLSFILMAALVRICLPLHPRVGDHLFQKLQLASSGLMALSHGMNDAQKAMGIITLALFAFNRIPLWEVSVWVRIACAAAMALGTFYGGLRIIKTGRYRVFELESMHGFVSNLSAALVTLISSAMGAPISTTHVFASTIVGVGSSKRLSAVRWGIARNMIVIWLLTIPAAALMGGLVFHVLKLI